MRLTHFLTQGKRRIILTYRRVIQPHHKVPFSYDCFVHLLSIIIFSTGASAMTSIPKPNHFFLLHCIVYLYEHTACDIWFWVRKESNKLNFHALPLPPLNYHLCQHIVIKPFEPYVVFVVTVGVFFYRSKVFLRNTVSLSNGQSYVMQASVWLPWFQTFQTGLKMDAYLLLTYLFPR